MTGKLEVATAEDAGDNGERVVRVVCPDCAGALAVRRENTLLVFRCLVGHAYAPNELLMAKEDRLEHRLWSAVAALEELAALIDDLATDRDRAQRARRDAGAIRAVIERNAPVRFDPPGDAGPSEETS